MKKITILIPCFNEEKGIGKVIDGIPVEKLKKLGFTTDIIVINNNSTDDTARVAMRKGVILVDAVKKGKGNAMKTGFNSVSKDTDYVVMLDGDNTYKGHEIHRIIEPLESNFADVVVGSRLGGRLLRNSLRLENRIGNWASTFLVRHFYHANITDVLSGYFAWKKEVIDDLLPHLESDGFSIEMEMIIKMVRLGYYICAVPITYDKREGISKLNKFSDGINIMHMFLRHIFWKPQGKRNIKLNEYLSQ